eukprot:m.38280 g.38280  ORF g.38280 m.38280 type:complete len:659 (+) comp5879_c0_seq2:1-1977(+)
MRAALLRAACLRRVPRPDVAARAFAVRPAGLRLALGSESFLARRVRDRSLRQVHASSVLRVEETHRSASLAAEFVRSHTCGDLRAADEGCKVTLCGWMQDIRDFGESLSFVTLRDGHGLTQLVLKADSELRELPRESVIGIRGTVQRRPGNMANPNMATGDIEVAVSDHCVFSKAEELPFPVFHADNKANEHIRLKHRYLDLRRKQLHDNILLRSRVALHIRSVLDRNHKFVEVETPTLFKRTPGGAAEFLVPTREEGQVYALVQSPQQLKQLLMVGGIDRYFQFARCYRDEGGRGDRQPEFTQIDLEVAFGTKAIIQSIIEDILRETWRVARHEEIDVPFRHMTYAHAMSTYGSDKPDTRFGMEFCDVTKPFSSSSSDFLQGHMQGGTALAFRVPASLASLSRAELDGIVAHAAGMSTKPLCYAQVAPDQTLRKGIAKQFTEAEQREIIASAKASEGDFLFFTMGRFDEAASLLGKMRLHCADRLEERGTRVRCGEDHFLWVEDFPLFELGDQGRIFSTHHPFTAPVPEDEHKLFSAPLEVRGQHFDIVINGVEVGGGSIRAHNHAMQTQIIRDILQEDVGLFSQLLEGLRFGAPPHGGIALGFDRLMMLVCRAQNLREVLAFPKSFAGRDLMADCPSPALPEDLETYHLCFRRTQQ